MLINTLIYHTENRNITMTDITELLSNLQPYRPKMRQDMPLLVWAEEYMETGFIQIPVYISSKKTENPEGFKWSKVRTTLINGYSNMTPQERQLLQECFVDSSYALVTDMQGLRQVLVFQREFNMVVKARGNAVNPLIKVFKRQKSEETEVEVLETDQEVEPQIVEEVVPESKKRRGRKNKK